MSQIVIVPDTGESSFVALSASKRGKVFEKHILSYGDLLYPGVKGGKVTIDDAFADKLIENFNKKYCPYVQVPLADDQNRHSEAPDRNLGQVIGLTKRDGKIYASIDFRKHTEDVGETLLGASALFDINYTDTKTLTSVGPTLLHVAVTNRPYITDLEDFQERVDQLVAASADSFTSEPVVLTLAQPQTEEKNMTPDEMFTALREEHGIDVPALQEKQNRADEVIALSNRISEKLQETGLVALSAGETEMTPEQVLAAIEDASTKIVALSNTIEKNEKEARTAAATAEIEDLARRGFILPEQKSAMVTLSMEQPDVFKALLPTKPLIALSAERGTDNEPTDEDLAKAEIERLTSDEADAHLFVSKQ